MSGLKSGRSFHGDAPTENLAYALPARAREMPPNYHQQPTIATGSHLRTWSQRELSTREQRTRTPS